MPTRDYPGYPEVVIITLPNFVINPRLCVCFSQLGYKVFSALEVTDFAFAIDDYGKKKIEFAEMAKTVWEDNQYDVIIETSGLFWKEMAARWPKTKFVNLVRDDDERCNTFKDGNMTFHSPKGWTK